ncbi:carboxypeptidase regulatory-like domain-containing protein [Candidatus Kaiserbacteria bacterium]|nr:carboxypeptidase regulatory-like domain-containing protein [Candidatus Kaiserbacteria bacterium]
MSTLFIRAHSHKGASLLDAIFGTALFLVVFLGIFGAFQLSLQLVKSTALKTGALALANERLEYIRSLPYNDIGVVGGIPQGELEMEEAVVLNNTSYTRRTFVQYIDDPADGSGGNDENGVTADYKTAKVTMSWPFRESTRSLSLVTNIIPSGIESIEGGGTLRISVPNAVGAPIPSASVYIENTTVSPAIGFSTFTNTSGLAVFPGAPSGSRYEITVTKTGYSSTQTYDSTAQNIEPNPGHLTVSESQTTTGTFAIDILGQATVRSFEVIKPVIWEDLFPDTSQIASLQSTELSGGAIALQDSESGYPSSGSVWSATQSPQYLAEWTALSWNDTTPAGTNIRYSLYYGGGILVPDSDLGGNESGFTNSPIDLSGLNVGTYDNLYIAGALTSSDASSTPSILDWRLDYKVGPTPLPNIAFSLTGAKTIGTDAGSNPIYKYDTLLNTGANTQITIGALEWDNYTLAVDDAVTGYDTAETCPLSPFALLPDEDKVVDVLLAENTTNSLHVAVKNTSGTLLSDATVRLYGGSYDTTQETSACGQTFFNNSLSSGTYAADVSLSGYQSTTISNITVSGDSDLVVTLNVL